MGSFPLTLVALFWWLKASQGANASAGMQGATEAAMFVNLVNITLGAGLLSIPWAFAGASLGGGAQVTAVATAWCTCTNLVLVYAAEQEQKSRRAAGFKADRSC